MCLKLLLHFLENELANHQYVLGIANSLSGDLTNAEDLYNDALQHLNTKDKSFPIFAILHKKLPFRISELYEIRALQAYKEWVRSRKLDAIDNLGAHLQKVAASRKNNPEILNLSAMMCQHFTGHKVKQHFAATRSQRAIYIH